MISEPTEQLFDALTEQMKLKPKTEVDIMATTAGPSYHDMNPSKTGGPTSVVEYFLGNLYEFKPLRVG